ncbi:hypothetical protein RFI_34381, partial [Reticulomyxa filosa]
TITVKLSGKQFNNAFNYFISRFNCEKRYLYDDKYANLLAIIAQRLDEKQMNIVLNYCMDKLNDKNEHPNIRIKCTQLLTEVSNKCNEQQLNEAFNSSMDIFNDKNDNAHVRMECAELLETIAVNLNGKHFNDAFQCFTNGLKDDMQYSCAKSLITLSKKWDDR